MTPNKPAGSVGRAQEGAPEDGRGRLAVCDQAGPRPQQDDAVVQLHRQTTPAPRQPHQRGAISICLPYFGSDIIIRIFQTMRVANEVGRRAALVVSNCRSSWTTDRRCRMPYHDRTTPPRASRPLRCAAGTRTAVRSSARLPPSRSVYALVQDGNTGAPAAPQLVVTQQH